MTKETYQRKTKNIWFPKQREPNAVTEPDLFLGYWQREKDRLINGFYLADKQVFISGWLYWHTVYWTIELNTEINGKSYKTTGTPTFRDIDWEMGINKEKAELNGEIIEIVGARGFGKSLPSTTRTHLIDGGFKEIGSLKVNDFVIGRDGQPTKVLGVFPQGSRPMYKFTLADGREITSDDEHLWGLYKNGKYKVFKTKDIVNNYKYKHPKSGYTYKYSIPEIDPIQYIKKDLPIDPYVLGALIGDGSMNSSTPRISTQDEEILNELKLRLPEYRFVLDNSKSNTNKNIRYNISYNGSWEGGPINPLSRNIDSLGLRISCHDKFIPEIYKYGSIEQRLELLQGLMDTDGSINTEGSIEFTNSSKRLAEDVMFLARSLGIRCQLGIDDRIGREQLMPQGKISITSNLIYRIFMRTDLPIFKLSRKVERLKPKKKAQHISIVNIERVSDCDATCIFVDNQDHLFLVEDYIPTHNSVWDASIGGYYYTLMDDVEICISGAFNTDIRVVTDKIEVGLTNIHPILKKQRIQSNWKTTVRAGFKDKKTGQPSDKSSNSRFEIRNYEAGNKSMACNGLRPKFHVIDEIGKIFNLKACVSDTIPCWLNPDTGKYLAVIILSGTGGDMEVGMDAGEMFFEPYNWNILQFDDIWENRGKIGWFMPATKAIGKYKNPKTLGEYLGISHPDLDHITIMVSDEERCMQEFVVPRRLKSEKAGQSALTKEKAYYPIKPSESFLVISQNPFNTDNAKVQQLRIKEKNLTGTPIEIYHDGDKLVHKFSDKKPVERFPVRAGDKIEGCVVMIEPPMYGSPWGLYTAGIDPYNQDKSENSDSLGACYIFKRIHSITDEAYQDIIVAYYVGRPDDQFEWYETVRNLLKFYNATALCENENPGFIQYMTLKGDGHYLRDQPEWLKDIHSNSSVNRTKGLHVTPKIRDYLNNHLKKYLNDHAYTITDEEGKQKELLGVHKVLDPLLLEEIVKYNATGNFDRIVAASLAIAYAHELNEKMNAATEDTNIGYKSYFSRINGRAKNLFNEIKRQKTIKSKNKMFL